MKRIANLLLIFIFTGSLSWAQEGIANGGFERNNPNYFSKGGSSTSAIVSWGTDQWRTGGHS